MTGIPRRIDRGALIAIAMLVLGAITLLVPGSSVQAETDQPAHSVSIDPATISLNQRDPEQTVDAVVKLHVPADQVHSDFTIAPSGNLVSGMVVKAQKNGDTVIETAADGSATGDVRQIVRLTFNNIPSRLESTKVPFTVTFGKLMRYLDLAVSNVQTPPTGSTLTMRTANPTGWRSGELLQINLATTGADAPAITFTAGPFTDAALNRTLQLGFCMVEQREGGACVASISLPANSNKTIWLKADGTTNTPGTYVGTIDLRARNGLTASQSTTLTVTSHAWRWGGALVLLLGIAISCVLTVYLPYRRTRDLALRPFLLLRLRLARTQMALESIKADNTKAHIKAIDESLGANALLEEGLLTGNFPTSEAMSNDALKARLDAATAKVAKIEELVAALFAATPPQQAELDTLAAGSDLPGDLTVAIDRILHPAPAARGMARGRPPTSPREDLARIARREDVRNAVTWIFSAIVSAVFGIWLVVVADAAFGGFDKLLAAFLWGLGVTSGATKLAEVTTGSIGTALRPQPRS